MTLEGNLSSVVGSGLVDAAGGSIVLIGLIGIIGIAIFMKKLEFGLSSGIMVAVLILGILSSSSMDSRFLLGNEIGSQIPFFKLLYLGIIVGAAIYWAIFLRRR